MTTIAREQLHQQIDSLPEDVVQLIEDFALFIMARRQIAPPYADWGNNQWQQFALGQFFRDDDEQEASD